MLERFRREAQITARLDHSGICPVYETGTAGDVPYIAMRYVEGETLAGLLARARTFPGATGSSFFRPAPGSDTGTEPEGPPGAMPRAPSAPSTRADVARVVALIEKAARALHAAHEAGVIHRDVKPGNIIVRPDGEPVILDFGLARELETEEATLTQTGALLGTPQYLSPEQLAVRRVPLDRRTDIYSLGVTLYEGLTLEHPFRAPTRAALYMAILTMEPTDPRRLNPAISADLGVVVQTALEKDRDRRYQTGLDFAEDLRRVREHEPIRARPVGHLTKLLRWAQRSPALAASLTAAFLILVAGTMASTILALKARHHAQRADAKTTESTSRLGDWERLADAVRLDSLRLQADEDLWPAVPEKAAAMEVWLGRARELVSRLPEHRATLDRIQAKAAPYTDEMARKDRDSQPVEPAPMVQFENQVEGARRQVEDQLADLEARSDLSARDESRKEELSERLDALKERSEWMERRLGRHQDGKRIHETKLVERLTWEFDDPRLELQHDTLHELVSGLVTLAGKADRENVTIAGMEHRLEFARTLRKRTIEDHAGAWKEAIERIARNPEYGGLGISPQPGLIPLGPDPESTLEEFADTATGMPLERRKDLKLSPTEEMSLVFVLLPGGKSWMGAQQEDPAKPNYDREAQPEEGERAMV